MRKTLAIVIVFLALLITGLTASMGCDAARGEAKIYLEGVSTGSMSMDGKPVSGLPSQKTEIALKLSASKVSISVDGDKTTIRLSPSEAYIVIEPEGISLNGVESDKIELEWQYTE